MLSSLKGPSCIGVLVTPTPGCCKGGATGACKVSAIKTKGGLKTRAGFYSAEKTPKLHLRGDTAAPQRAYYFNYIFPNTKVPKSSEKRPFRKT